MSAALIVDLGSSHVAWRFDGEGGRAAHEGRPGALLVDRLPGVPARIFVGSVAAPSVLEEFGAEVRAAWGIAPRTLHSGAAAGGVRNGYRRPEQLGIDRWAAMVAAFHRHGGPLLVADCGTALTVDCVDGEGLHRGGLIVPGLALMRAALLKGTRLDELPSGAVQAGAGFGLDTGEAVARGCVEALAGAIERARSRAAAMCGPRIQAVLAGGDGPALLPHLGDGWLPWPGLVLDGLALLAGEAA